MCPFLLYNFHYSLFNIHYSFFADLSREGIWSSKTQNRKKQKNPRRTGKTLLRFFTVSFCGTPPVRDMFGREAAGLERFDLRMAPLRNNNSLRALLLC